MQAVLNEPVTADQARSLMCTHHPTQDVVVGLLIGLGFLVALVFAVAPAPQHYKASNGWKVLLPVLWGGKELAMAVFQAAPVLFGVVLVTEGLLAAGLLLELL